MRGLTPEQVRQLPPLEPPAGYICVIRDVAYQDRFAIDHARNSSEILAIDARFAFMTEVALIARVEDNAAESARELRRRYGGGDEWFTLSRAQLREIARSYTQPRSSQAQVSRNRSVSSRSQSRPPRSSSQRRRKLAYVILIALIIFVAGSMIEETGWNFSGILEREATLSASAQEQAKPKLAVSFKTARSIAFIWQAVPGAESYEYRYSVNYDAVTNWRTTTRLGLDVSRLSPGDRVYFQVRAVAGEARSPIASMSARTRAAPAPTMTPIEALPSATATFTRMPAKTVTLSKPKLSVNSKSANGITFGWRAVRGAERYETRYYVNHRLITGWRMTDGLRQTVAGLSPGDRVSFQVRAEAVEARSPIASMTVRTRAAPAPTMTPIEALPSATATFTRIPAKTVTLSKPNLSVYTISANRITFGWRAVRGAERYETRYYVNNRLVTGWRVSPGLRQTVHGLSPGDRVNFQVRAVAGESRSPIASLSARTGAAPAPTITPIEALPSATATFTRIPAKTVTLSKPNLSINSISANRINFVWRAVRGAERYETRYYVNNRLVTGWRVSPGLRQTVAGLSPGDRVYFQVRAVVGEARSPIASLSTRTGAAPAPTMTAIEALPSATATLTRIPAKTVLLSKPKLSVNSISANRITFGWRAVRGAERYETLYYVNNRPITGWRMTDGLRQTAAGLSPGDRVDFQVRAVAGEARSPIASMSARTVEPPTATPTETSTATATLTATPPPTATSQTMFVETRNNRGANVRACPGTHCNILITLRPGDEIQVLARVNGESVYNSREWMQFEHNGELAFIHSALVEPKI